MSEQKKQKRKVLICTVQVLLSGCGTQVHMMQNAQTGEIYRCQASVVGGPSLYPIAQSMNDARAADDCAAGLQASGWRKLN